MQLHVERAKQIQVGGVRVGSPMPLTDFSQLVTVARGVRRFGETALLKGSPRPIPTTSAPQPSNHQLLEPTTSRFRDKGDRVQKTMGTINFDERCVNILRHA